MHSYILEHVELKAFHQGLSSDISVKLGDVLF